MITHYYPVLTALTLILNHALVSMVGRRLYYPSTHNQRISAITTCTSTPSSAMVSKGIGIQVFPIISDEFEIKCTCTSNIKQENWSSCCVIYFICIYNSALSISKRCHLKLRSSSRDYWCARFSLNRIFDLGSFWCSLVRMGWFGSS